MTNRSRPGGRGKRRAARTASLPSDGARLPLSSKTRLALLLRDGFACVWCGTGLEEGIVLNIDRVMPAPLGGTNDPSNLVTACSACLVARNRLSHREWLLWLGDRGVRTDHLGARVRSATRRSLVQMRRAR